VCLADDATAKKRTREKDRCCRRNSFSDSSLSLIPDENAECGIPETPQSETGDCIGIDDCCLFDEWTDWSGCELPDGRR